MDRATDGLLRGLWQVKVILILTLLVNIVNLGAVMYILGRMW